MLPKHRLNSVVPGLALRSVLFNSSLSDMDSGIDCTLSRCADHTRLCGVVSTLEGRENAIQRNLDRFEG